MLTPPTATWQEAAQRTLELACETLAKEDLRNVILLLDQAVGQMALGRASDLGLLVRDRPTRPIPHYLRTLRDHRSDPLDALLLGTLPRLHELRNTVVHHPQDAFAVGRPIAEDLTDGVIAAADRWGVKIRLGLRLRSRERAPFELLLEPGGSWGPDHHPPDESAAVIDSLRKRKMVAGYVSNLKWPLVRCDICDRCGPPEFFSTPQESWMDCAFHPVAAYCIYGCGARHQAVLQDAHPNDYYVFDYFLQLLVDLLTAGDRECTPAGCSDCTDRP